MDKSTKKTITGFCLASLLNDWCHEMGTTILPAFVAQLIGTAYAPLAVGAIQGISDAAATGMKLLSGYLADKVFFYKPFLVIGYGLTGICIALIGTAQSIGAVFVYKMIAWMSKGIREPMRDAWIAQIVAPQSYGKVFGLHRAFDTLGALMAPLSVLFLLRWYGSYRLIFFVALVPGMLSVMPLMLLARETREHPENNHNDINFIKQLRSLPMSFVYFIGVMLLFGCGNFNQALLLYRVQDVLGLHHMGPLFATTWSVGMYLVFNSLRACAESGIGYISDYINRRKLLSFFGFGLFGITSILCISTTSSWWFWFFVFGCAGVSAGTVKALEKAYAAYMLPEQVRGTGLGVLQAIDGVGDLISSVLVGVMWSFGSAEMAFGYAAVVSIIAMIMLLYPILNE